MSKYTTRYVAQLPAGTLFAGIDLSLDSLVTVVLNGSGQRLDRWPAAVQRGRCARAGCGVTFLPAPITLGAK